MATSQDSGHQLKHQPEGGLKLLEKLRKFWSMMPSIRFLRIAVIVLVLATLFAIGTLTRDVRNELRTLKQAPRDNVHWTILQVQSELNMVRLQLSQLDQSDDSTARDFARRYNIFYSRVDLLKSARIFDMLRQKPFFQNGIRQLSASLDKMTPIVDQGPEGIFQNRAFLERQLQLSSPHARDFVIKAVAEFARISDEKRLQLSQMLYSLAAVALLFFLILVLSIMSLRRHAKRLEYRSGELMASEERMAATVRSALDAVIVADSKGIILDFNDQASDCFGYSHEEAIGSPLAELIIPQAMRDAHNTGMKRFLDSGEAKIIGQRIEIDALHANGSEFPVELAIGVAKKDGSPIFVAYARDISKRRSDEQELKEAHAAAQAADQAKSRFLAVMSHEMRTPLNGVLGVIDLLRNTELSSKQLELLTTASNSGEILLDLINDVLELSKMEAGKLHLDSVDFDFADLPASVNEIIEVHAEMRGNRIKVETDPAIPNFMHGDSKRLRQVILNLVSNANKFTTNGTICLNSKLIGINEGVARLKIEVSDTGIGIPAEKLPDLFSEFTTIDNSYKRRQGGTGLGLTISKHLITLMGGEIHADSTFGEGSRFWVEFPLPLAEAPTVNEVADKGKSGARHNDIIGTILLAEDNPTNAMVAETMLRDAGHEVMVVTDGSQAVKASRLGQFDLILMDISMPELDGIEATQLIRSLPAPISSTPIVAMTAHALPDDRQRFLDAGMQAYLTKPVRRGELLSIVQDQLARTTCESLVKSELKVPGEDNADLTILDTAELDQLASEIGAEHIPIVLEQFMQDAEVRTSAISNAQEENDLINLKKAAHALGGSSATVGAVKLAGISRDIEAACSADDRQRALAYLPALHDTQAATLLACQSYLEGEAALDCQQQDKDALQHAV